MKRRTHVAVAALAVWGIGLAPVPAVLAAPAQGSAGTLQQPGQLPVVPASQIVGRAVVDPQGRDAGRIRTLIIDTATGQINYVLIGSRGDFNLDADYAVAPWRVLHGFMGNGAVRLNVSADKLANGPQVNQRAMAYLNEPSALQDVMGYYGYGYGGNWGAYGRAGYPWAWGAPYGYYGYGYNNRPYGYNAAGAYDNRPPNADDLVSNPPGGTGLAVNTNGIVSALTSSQTMSADALRSISVHARNGDMVGDVDQVVIDPVHGMVAFLLIKRGGFLGLDPSWFAIPVEALSWSRSDNQYQLTVNERRLDQVPAIPAYQGNLTNDISARSLAQLYSIFGVTPYWSSASAGARPPRAG
ncbi:MAG: PRC-barrel domain-containing protein [Acetobacteraceae bacterium]